jgi:pilus assembly protein Flp/PilA
MPERHSRERIWVKLRAEKNMSNLITRFVRDESGATAIEYGLIAAGIAVAIIAAVNAVGTALNTTFTNVKDNLTPAS